MENLITYRYLIKNQFSEKTLVTVVTLTEKGHGEYIKQLKADTDVVKFSREYMHEYDVEKLYLVDNFDNEVKNEEI